MFYSGSHPMPAYQRLFDPPDSTLPPQDDLDFLPDSGGLAVFPAGTPTDGLFDLREGVGAGQANRPEDVCRLQALLHLEGYLDTAITNGPSGHWDARADFSLRKFQKDNGLAIDGIVRPGGETIEAMRSFSR
jgi:hypothetical protein